MRTVRIVITGQVQGVGFRMWLAEEAETVDVNGWVANRRDGSVEAVLSGDEDAVELLILICRSGPRGARVAGVSVTAEPAANLRTGFTIRPNF